MRTIPPLNSQVSLRPLRWFTSLALVVGLALSAAQMLAAQIPATQKPAAATPRTLKNPTTKHPPAARKRVMRRPVHPRRRSIAMKRRLAAHPEVPVAAAPIVAAPAAPPLPLWPANEKPSLASVTWDSQGLRIDAANSSLVQILRDVSAATGAKVEGLNSDERIFGDFGPGPARDVLSQLLQGSGYNIVMIGDQGAGTPRKIVLTPRPSGGAAPPAAYPTADSEDDSSVEDQPSSPPPFRTGFGPGDQRDPQEKIRQMKMQGRGQPPVQPGNPQL